MNGAVSYFLKAFAVIAFATLTWNAPDAQTRLNSIQVDGNARVPDASVISFSGLTPGEVASDGQLNDAIQSIMGSGLFETAEIVPTGGGIRIIVVERPTISRISIEGNRRLDDDALTEVISSTPRRVYSPTTAARDASAELSACSAASA